MSSRSQDVAELTIIGGGLAGCEAAWQAARRGLRVRLCEMRPAVQTGAHTGGDLAELVCSNSLGSALPDRATGLLQAELRKMGSLLLACADTCRLPAGGALAVDRTAFARTVTEHLSAEPNIHIQREEVAEIPDGPAIVSSGPLTSPRLARAVAALSGEDHLYFFDAIAPIVTRDSIDMNIAFAASRYERGEQAGGDYINCPFNRDEYEAFVSALLAAERIALKPFEDDVRSGVRAGEKEHFEGCLPIEVLAGRGRDALAFGPMRPVGLRDPRTGRRPHAVLQLRQDNLAGDLFNLVGFQTNLTYPEQCRVFHMIPGLERAEFARYGQMHRNTFLAAPKLLHPTLQFRAHADLFFAGQITGIEGYAGNIGSGLLAGLNAARLLHGQPPLTLPETTMLGALCRYVTHAAMADFQPMKANFGLLPALENAGKSGRRERGGAYAERALAALRLLPLRHNR
ncbi:MAG: methylenetetrahydrofolate--tRNA-(uracil(54)-C(5))-methyltransferase (FADH(2)-oxidizing) TrmFO [Kiritimatiellae bacterium]|nr:methylenetetrahydrofolate--tRNA-(uracil(54)-C(5))-methyltransferase (FADH(2)-oxidizing) TrmFO [Kiritimatiellia bacterium]